MTTEELKAAWKSEEDCAFIQGWDFSHIKGRYGEEDSLPWDYEAIIRSVLQDEMKLLDYDTGGGEFLLSLIIPMKTRLRPRVIRRMLRSAGSGCCRWGSICANARTQRGSPSTTHPSISSSIGTATLIRRRSDGC